VTASWSSEPVIDGKIDWGPVGWLSGVVALGVLGILGVVALGRYDLVVFAAPLLGALAGAWYSVRPHTQLAVKATVSGARVFEGDTITLDAELSLPPDTELADAEVQTGPELAVELVQPWEPDRDGILRARWNLNALRWGRAGVHVGITVRGASGLLIGDAHCTVSEVAVFPSADRIGSVPRPKDLPDLLGVHLGRRKGDGVEFAGIREYQYGDSLRSVNWAVTARRGTMHVTERLAEQSARVVTMIDASGDLRQPGPSTLELSVHGGLSVIQAALRRGDRAGLVALGGVVRWMPPDLGRKHFYRVMEALLDVQVGTGLAPSDGGAFPRTVLPHGSAVVVFTPLLDERVINALADLRRRGFGMAVIDVLRAEPQPRPGADYDPLAVRMWKLGREGVRDRLAQMGVPVSTWREGTELDEVLRPMSVRPLTGRH
jgi:uncharacterized protein (DUF58 family)